MKARSVAPFGSWSSPVSTDLIAGKSISLDQVLLDGDDVYWLELRPEEGGRTVVVRRTADGQQQDVTPPGYDVRTRVHEYGGAAYTVAGGRVFFANFADQQL